MPSSPLFDPTVTVAGKTYPTLGKDVADFPERLTDVEANAEALDAGLRHWVHVGTVSTKAADSGVLRMPAPGTGAIVKIKIVLNGALATGNATLQANIGGDPVTGGLVTMTQSGSAAGDVDSATATAENTFVENDLLEFEIGGTSTADETAEVFALLSY